MKGWGFGMLGGYAGIIPDDDCCICVRSGSRGDHDSIFLPSCSIVVGGCDEWLAVASTISSCGGSGSIEKTTEGGLTTASAAINAGRRPRNSATPCISLSLFLSIFLRVVLASCLCPWRFSSSFFYMYIYLTTRYCSIARTVQLSLFN